MAWFDGALCCMLPVPFRPRFAISQNTLAPRMGRAPTRHRLICAQDSLPSNLVLHLSLVSAVHTLGNLSQAMLSHLLRVDNLDWKA